jgi:hypothetical protein
MQEPETIRRGWFRLLVLSGLTFALGMAAAYLLPPSNAAGHRAAFTVTSLQKWDAGPGEARVSIVEGFRSDGSQAIWARGFWPKADSTADETEMRSVISPVTRSMSLMFPQAKSVSTFEMGERRAAYMTASVNCESLWDRLAGHMESAEYLGFRVLKHIVEPSKSEANRDWLLERWIAPELNCHPLRVVIWDIAADGSRKPRSVREAASVILGEPDPKLFEIPGDYVERPPGEAERELAIRNSGSWAYPSYGFQRLDEKYHGNRILD